MVQNRSHSQGCLITVFIFLGLGAILLVFDYGLLAAHTGPSFCQGPECESILKFLNISAIGAVSALVCAILSAFKIGPNLLPAAAIAAMLVSVTTGLLTGVSLRYAPNVVVTGVLTWLFLILAADQ